MHWRAAIAVCDSVRRRQLQGDCPTEPRQPVEVLEDALLELFRQVQVAKLRRDPDDEPTAGTGHD